MTGPTSMDPRTIRFSIPTLAKDGPKVQPAERIEPNDLVFHEDGWRQIEMFPIARCEVLRDELIELKAFEAAHRVQHGWTEVYLRDLPPAPVLPGAHALETLAKTLKTDVRAAPVLFYGANVVVGRIAHGFTLPLGRGASLYGVCDASGIVVLAADLNKADDKLLSHAFITLNEAHGLLLVDWRSQMLLESVSDERQIILWRP